MVPRVGTQVVVLAFGVHALALKDVHPLATVDYDRALPFSGPNLFGGHHKEPEGVV